MEYIIDENKKEGHIIIESSSIKSYECFPVDNIFIQFNIKKDDTKVYPAFIKVKFEGCSEYINKKYGINNKSDVPKEIVEVMEDKGYKIGSF